MTNLQKEFEKETNLKSKIIITDGVHVVGIEIYNPKYIEWLEKQIEQLDDIYYGD